MSESWRQPILDGLARLICRWRNTPERWRVRVFALLSTLVRIAPAHASPCRSGDIAEHWPSRAAALVSQLSPRPIKALADALDDLDELVKAIAVAAGEVD